MPAVLVHGVPDTAQLWDALRSHLSRTDIVTPTYPGFGGPVPSGFDATKEAYVDWLIGELEAVGEPVDLVGHDWGSLLVQRVTSIRPDLVRTWAAGSGPVDRDYVWHDTAQLWQTPEIGEQVMAAMTPEAMGEFFTAEVGAEHAQAVASKIDGTMKECILTLYRSAVNVGAEWADEVDKIARPGLVLWGADDPYVTPNFAEQLAKRTGARCVVFENTAHWWPVTRAAEAARELERHWQ
jgi:pimeloyl-ACP methyl ester carboxylesterase